MNKNDCILVAGYTGLIGSAVTKNLQYNGYENLILINSSNCNLENIQDVKDLFHKYTPNYVVNAAGKVGGIIFNDKFPADLILKNIQIQSNLFHCSQEYDIKKFIFFGSSCMYPKNIDRPIKVNDLMSGYIENSSNAYAIAKLSGIYSCLALNRQFNNKKYIPLIPNSVYGPNDNFDLNSSHVLSALIRKFHSAKIQKLSEIVLWGSGEPKREFVYSEDLASLVFLILSEKINLTEFPINVGVGIDISIKDLALLIANIVGYSGRISWDQNKPDGTSRKILDSDLIRKVWKPKYSLSEGISNTYDWFLKNINE